ncbi:hypothetical protein CR513_02083, partial [Mucuna pruriens]
MGLPLVVMGFTCKDLNTQESKANNKSNHICAGQIGVQMKSTQQRSKSSQLRLEASWPDEANSVSACQLCLQESSPKRVSTPTPIADTISNNQSTLDAEVVPSIWIPPNIKTDSAPAISSTWFVELSLSSSSNLHKLDPKIDRTLNRLRKAKSADVGANSNFISIPSYELEQMENNNRTLKELATLDFHDLVGEHPHKHLKEFHAVCSTMRPQRIPKDYIKMKAFPFSLDRATKDWLYL